MMLRGRRGCKRRGRGAAAVEFVAILPVLTTLLLAGIDFGMFGFRYLQVQSAAMAAANYGAMTPYDETNPLARPAWETQMAVRAKDEMFGRSETARRNRVVVSDISVTPVPDPPPPPDPPRSVVRSRLVKVVVTYDFNTIVNWPMLPRTFPLRGSAAVYAIR